MHPEALRAVHDMIRQSGADLTRHEDGRMGPIGLDIGGADVNGSARRWFPDSTTWIGLDIAPGPGVDIVADATTWRGESSIGYPVAAWPLPAFDIVLCTELLEHVERWPAVLETIHAALVPGGYAFITCASDGRRPHGARGELDPPSGEYYGNVGTGDFTRAVSSVGLLDDYSAPPWIGGHATYNPNPGDLYAWLRKA